MWLQDKSIFILCEETSVPSSTISLYFLGKINFENVKSEEFPPNI